MDLGSIFLTMLAVVSVVVVFGIVIAAFSRYKRCPPDKILVVSGKVGKGADGNARSAKCIHGGATFVWPVIQQYEYMDLTPITIEIDLQDALSKQNIRVSTPCTFTVGVSSRPEVMQNAAERLLGHDQERIKKIAGDIIFGQLRVVLATMDIEEINANRDALIHKVMENVGAELNKIGLDVINVNIKDVRDTSGYIDALGQQAAARAINDAKRQVAEHNRDGETGQANAEREQRVNVADANAKAVTGENVAKVDIANSDATRRVAEAEAKRLGDAATTVKDAAALQEGYRAQQTAEEQRAERERATQTADIVVPAEIAKRKVVIDAEAQKEQVVLEGQGRGGARRAELEGEAEGLRAVLTKKAEGFEAIVKAAGGNVDKAAMLMIVEQLPAIARLQAEAISNIAFEKVVVYDGGAGSNGRTTTADWLSNITRILPQLHEFAAMAGVELPQMLGRQLADSNATSGEGTNAAVDQVVDGETDGKHLD